LSVADNAGDAVFLLVSASNERPECGIKAELKKGTKPEILKQQDVLVSFCIVVLFHRYSGHTFIFTRDLMSDCHTQKKTFLKLFSTLVKKICICWKNESFSMTTPKISYKVFTLHLDTIYKMLNTTKSFMKMYLLSRWNPKWRLNSSIIVKMYRNLENVQLQRYGIMNCLIGI